MDVTANATFFYGLKSQRINPTPPRETRVVPQDTEIQKERTTEEAQLVRCNANAKWLQQVELSTKKAQTKEGHSFHVPSRWLSLAASFNGLMKRIRTVDQMEAFHLTNQSMEEVALAEEEEEVQQERENVERVAKKAIPRKPADMARCGGIFCARPLSSRSRC